MKAITTIQKRERKHMKRNKTVIFVICVLLLTIGVLAGCGGNNSKNSEGNTTNNAAQSDQATNPQEEPKKNVKLSMSVWGDDNFKNFLEGLVTQFRTEHSHVDVEINLTPWDEYQRKVSIGLATNEGPDLGMVSSQLYLQLLETDQMESLNDLAEKSEYNFQDFSQRMVDFFTHDGQIYGIPFNSGPSMLYFNKDMFEAKGIKTPLEHHAEGTWTYDQFLETAIALTDVANNEYGTELVRNNWQNWNDPLINIIWAFGAELFDDDFTTFLLHSPEGEAALQFFYDLVFEHKAHPGLGSQVDFAAGNIGMFRQRYNYSISASKIENFKWDIAPWPVQNADAPSEVSASAFSLFKGSDHPEEAKLFLEYLTSTDAMIALSDHYPPVRKSVQDSDYFLSENNFEGLYPALLDPINDNPRVNTFPSNWQEVNSAIQMVLDELYTGKVNVPEALQKMEERVTPLLAE